MARPQPVIPIERIASKIYLIRGEKVMLDSDLADLYRVETGALVRAVKRNINRFPDDFAFQLTDVEFENLRCQIGTSKNWGGRRYAPHAFTEQGVAMLSSVLRGNRAAEVNVAIMRTYVRMREILASDRALARKVAEHDRHISNLYQLVKNLMALPEPKKNPIGYIHPKD